MSSHMRRGVVLLALLVASGCSFSKSSESISKSISSPFTSSSESSKSDATRFREETEEYSAAYVRAGGGTVEAFRKGLSEIAARRGISDWESNPMTWRAIGRGLGRAGITEAEALAYGMSWSGGDDARTTMIRDGFYETR